MITEYLAQLLDELRLPRRRRRRIVAEVEDHLWSAAADLHASGLEPDAAEREAVRRFGPASAVARAFVEQEGAAAGTRLARASGVLGVLCAVLVLGPPGRAFEAQPFPSGLIDFVLGQVALVAGTLTLLRGLRATAEGGPAGTRLALVLRGAVVVLACTAVTVAHDAALTVGGWAVLAVLAVGSIVTGVMLVRGLRFAAAAGASAARFGPSDDALADLEAVARIAIERFGLRVPNVAPRLRAHPWRLAVSLAVLAGLALAATHGIGEGISIHHLGGALIAGALIVTIEAAAALAGFAVLGRFLAIRSR